MLLRVALLYLIAMIVFGAEERSPAERLVAAALKDEAGLARLEYLCYRIGNRVTGSPALDEAIRWSIAEMKSAGLENVRTIPAKVPHWVRGDESAEMLAPVKKKLYMLGLGLSVGTAKGGVTADVVAVSDFEELEKLGRAGVEGKIVLFDAPYVSYGKTVVYRSAGASRAAKLGAVAVLVRSITPRSLRDPHTGALRYAADAPKIPAAAVSVEDAIWIHHLAQAGQKVRVHLEMNAQSLPEVESADVMGEIRGSEKPEEVVVIGGHLDSWDVGQGAHDDGSGVVAALQAVTLMKQLGLKPKRTIRVVFWTSEENSGNGGTAYRAWVGDAIGRHTAAIEMDGGAERPIGFEVTADAAFQDRVRRIAPELKSIGADTVREGAPEADVDSLSKAGVPVLGLRTTMEHYFDYHHTEADTFDKIVPDDFRRCVAAFAVMSFGLAEM